MFICDKFSTDRDGKEKGGKEREGREGEEGMQMSKWILESPEPNALQLLNI